MAANVEIKARVADLGALRARAAALADGPPERLEQRDTFFVVPAGRLKLREFGDGTAELIQYERRDADGPKLSRYRRLDVPDPAGMRAALTDALGRRAVVAKTREVFLSGRTRIHLDKVAGLGGFMELEVVLAEGEDAAAGEAEARDLRAQLGIAPADLVTGAYVDLLEAAGNPARAPVAGPAPG